MWYIRRSPSKSLSDIYTKAGRPKWNSTRDVLLVPSRVNEKVVIVGRLFDGTLVRTPIVKVLPGDHKMRIPVQQNMNFFYKMTKIRL